MAAKTLAQHAQVQNETLRIRVMANMVQRRVSIARQAIEILGDDLEIPLMQSMIGSRSPFRECQAIGCTVHGVAGAVPHRETDDAIARREGDRLPGGRFDFGEVAAHGGAHPFKARQLLVDGQAAVACGEDAAFESVGERRAIVERSLVRRNVVFHRAQVGRERAERPGRRSLERPGERTPRAVGLSLRAGGRNEREKLIDGAGAQRARRLDARDRD